MHFFLVCFFSLFSAVVISCSYYQGERALIDCTQEYKARAFQREMRRKEIAAAREGKQ